MKNLRTLLSLFVTLFAVVFLDFPDASLAEENPDRVPQASVPEGTTKSGVFTDSKIFPGTVREYSVYVPAQYKSNSEKTEKPANLMVFMDGSGYAKKDGAFRV